MFSHKHQMYNVSTDVYLRNTICAPNNPMQHLQWKKLGSGSRDWMKKEGETCSSWLSISSFQLQWRHWGWWSQRQATSSGTSAGRLWLPFQSHCCISTFYSRLPLQSNVAMYRLSSGLQRAILLLTVSSVIPRFRCFCWNLHVNYLFMSVICHNPWL